LLQHGQFAAAEQAMIAGYQDYMVRHGGKVFHSFQAWKRCEVLCAAQQWAAAEVLLDEALELSLEQQERAYLAELMVIKACIQQGKGKQQEAEQGLRSALATALALGSVPARLQAAWALAQLLSAQGRDVEALDVARRAIRGVEFETPYPVLQAIVAWLSQPLE
jgi:tetratricopeptide (TPR) repeat protein